MKKNLEKSPRVVCILFSRALSTSLTLEEYLAGWVSGLHISLLRDTPRSTSRGNEGHAVEHPEIHLARYSAKVNETIPCFSMNYGLFLKFGFCAMSYTCKKFTFFCSYVGPTVLCNRIGILWYLMKSKSSVFWKHHIWYMKFTLPKISFLKNNMKWSQMENDRLP